MRQPACQTVPLAACKTERNVVVVRGGGGRVSGPPAERYVSARAPWASANASEWVRIKLSSQPCTRYTSIARKQVSGAGAEAAQTWLGLVHAAHAPASAQSSSRWSWQSVCPVSCETSHSARLWRLQAGAEGVMLSAARANSSRGLCSSWLRSRARIPSTRSPWAIAGAQRCRRGDAGRALTSNRAAVRESEHSSELSASRASR